ncbi:MAG: hypothetical protein EBE86_019695 [Hormoscilla sp. GUM202]|nr:hypothetical protein [Hormoscilla sp. GUM202]
MLTKIADNHLTTFYTQTPDFDLVNFDFTNPSAVEELSQTFSGNGTTLNRLKEYQRLLRLRADADSAKALHDKGYTSAHQIAGKSEKQFIREVKDEIDTETARQIYQKATDVKARVAHLWANIHNIVASPHFRSLRVNPVNNDIVEFFSNIPSYPDMFGSLDYYECEHCQSLLSPSAYFVDLMWLVDKYITEPNLSEIPDDFQLGTRRPDLAHIPLTCENTNDLVPFLQIVNDILKTRIEGEQDITDADRHFATAKYPFNLPFNLPLEQIRRYLEHLNADLAFIYQTFNAPEEAIGRELAGLSIEGRQLITTSETDEEELKELYGLYETENLTNLAERDKFLQQTGLSRQELVNLLHQNLSAEELEANLPSRFYINQVLDDNYVKLIIPDEDNPEREELENLQDITLDRIHRFVRFANILDWSFADLDWVMNSIVIRENPNEDPPDIDSEAIKKIGQIKQLQKKTKLPLDVLCSLWYDMKTIGVGEGQTPEDLFDRIYNNPLILKGESAYHPEYENNPLYQDTAIEWQTDGLTDNEQKFGRSRLAAALKLGKNDLTDIREAIWGLEDEVPLTVKNLSQLFRTTQLLKILGLKVQEYQIFSGFLNIPIHEELSIDNAFEMISYAQWLQQAKFTVWELDYILNGNEYPSVEIAFSDSNIWTLMDSFWAMGLELPDDEENALDEQPTIHFGDEQLAIHFGIDTDLFIGLAHWAAIATNTPNYLQLLYTPVTEDHEDWPKIVTFLKAISRLLLLANMLNLTGVELDSIAEYPEQYNIDNPSQLTLVNVRNLDEFKTLVRAFQDIEDELVGYFEAIANEELDSKEEKCAKLSEISGWKQDEIEALVSANFEFEETVLDSVAGLVELKQCFDTIDAVGGNVSFIGKLRQLHDLAADTDENWNTYQDTARSTMHVVKAKYEGDRLAEVTSKLDGAIAEGQRDGMTEFLIWKLNHRWQEEEKDYQIENWRSLSEYLLIDVEMTGCASTSYIKQATLSVQMYLQRCQLGLETGVKQLDIPQPQWDLLTNYRLWEANRKIFLYPENYIEPDLRIDKSDSFRQLEDELLQGEITQGTVESAYRNYFDTFEELAKLQIVESCRYRIDDPSSLEPLDTLFVFGKTATEPPTYYYRRCLYPTAEQPIWEYWQKIDLQITSEYISPVYAFKRLFLFWVEWREITEAKAEDGSSTKSVITYATIKYSFLNSSYQWIQPQTLIKDIEVDPEQKDEIIWQKAYALALPETGSELERILTMLGGLKQKNGSGDYQLSDSGRSQLLTSDLLQEEKNLTLLTREKGWFEQDENGLSEGGQGIAVAVGHLAIFVNNVGLSHITDTVEIYNTYTNIWSQEQLCESRKNVAVAVVGHLVIVAGGFRGPGTYSKAVDIYNASTNSWLEQKTDRLCEARDNIAVAVVGNLAIFAGGEESTDHKSRAVDIYDASTNQWIEREPNRLCEARISISVATVGHLAIFAGGFAGNRSGAVDIYDASTNSWIEQEQNQLCEARYYIAVATVGHLAIFAGGVGVTNHSGAVDIYDASTNSWIEQEIGRLCEARDNIAVATVGHLAIFAGGFGVTDYSGAVDIYDASTNSWIEQEQNQLCEARYYIAVATVGHLAIFAGGYGVTSYSGAVDIYDASTNSWIEQETEGLCEARYHIAVATVGHLAIFAGGWTGSNTYSKAVDIYDASTNSWIEQETEGLCEDRYYIAAATVGSLAIFAGGWTETNATLRSKAVDIFNGNIPFRGSTNSTLTAITTDNVLYDNYMGDTPLKTHLPTEPSTQILGKLSQIHSAVIMVKNQPGWFVLNNGDEAFLTIPQQSEFEPINETLGIVEEQDDELDLFSSSFNLQKPSQLDYAFTRLTTKVIRQLSQKLFAGGLDRLLAFDSQLTTEPDFNRFQPENNVLAPTNEHLDYQGAYGSYFWEIFFHGPFLVANALNSNQQFAEVQQWYHYIFDPTLPENEEGNDEGLVGDWPMDEGSGTTLNDRAGSNNGTVNGEANWRTVTDFPPTPARKVLEFDGDSNFIEFGQEQYFGSEYTVSGWFKSSAASQQTIFAATQADGHSLLVQLGDNSNLRYLHRVPPGTSADQGTNIYSKKNYADGKWHHFAAVKDSRYMKLYVDAELVGIKEEDQSISDQTTIVVGKFSAGQNRRFFDGQIAAVRIWNIALPAHRVGIEAKPSARAWQFLPFRGHRLQTLQEILGNSQQINESIRNPFDPHAIARLRIGAYQKAIVMKYIENLLDWGDYFFSQDSWEAINRASTLYMFAYDILGPKPRKLGKLPAPEPKTYAELKGELENPNEFLLELEHHHFSHQYDVALQKTYLETLSSYFCVGENQEFVKYWDRVEDRLYKIRHCQNLQGVERQLALFQPPISPEQLVRAAAAGGSAIILPSSNNVPHYRFSYLLERAKGTISTVIQLGSTLLSVLEKQDAEELAAMRATHESNILQLVTKTKEKQVEEAQENLAALEKSLAAAQERSQHYQKLIEQGLSTYEQKSQTQAQGVIPEQIVANVTRGIAIPGYLLPNIFGFSDGGMQFGNAINQTAAIADGAAAMLNQGASLAATMGQHDRRDEDWEFQQNLAQHDIEQIEAQIAAAQVRIELAQADLDTHNQSIEQAREVEEFLQSKFTNPELYRWMVGRLSGLYFQTYKIALDMAFKAQTAYQYELTKDDTYIEASYWDSLKKGLLAGEGLLFSLHELEKAYIEGNERRFEVEKTISLLQLDPQALDDLKTKGSCNFSFDEALFDFDFSSHYCRQIKTISISIPAVVGPYQNINATLTQTSNEVLIKADAEAVKWLLTGDGDKPNTGTLRQDLRVSEQIAISKGVNDSGMFVLNFQDERYLPFEGTGAISDWRLEMPKSTNRFDFDSITDVIITLSYTALQGGSTIYNAVKETLTTFAGKRLFSLAQQFSSAWYQFMNPGGSAKEQTLSFQVLANMFPMNLTKYTVKQIYIQMVLAESADASGFDSPMKVKIEKGGSTPLDDTINLQEQGGIVSGSLDEEVSDFFDSSWSLSIDKETADDPLRDENGFLDPNQVTNIALVVTYEADIDWPTDS